MSLYDGIKDVANVVRKADNIELYQQLLDLGQIALDMQDEIRSLRQENYELKKKQDLDKDIVRHPENYVTIKSDDQQLKYCSVCWDNDRKLIQMKSLDKGSSYYCHVCKIKFNLQNQLPYPYY